MPEKEMIREHIIILFIYTDSTCIFVFERSAKLEEPATCEQKRRSIPPKTGSTVTSPQGLLSYIAFMELLKKFRITHGRGVQRGRGREGP